MGEAWRSSIRVLYGRGRWVVVYNPHGDRFYWGVSRFNSGTPYTSWKVGPIMVKRYAR